MRFTAQDHDRARVRLREIAGETGPPIDPPRVDHLAEDLGRGWHPVPFPRPGRKDDPLVGNPAPRTWSRWHLGCLRTLAASPTPHPRRAAFHARWLLYALEDWRPAEAPLVSIIIPVYNRAERARSALRSALGQDHSVLEIIVVDDGSCDRPENALAPLLEDPRVRFVRQENRGVSAARNRGLALARGHYIHFLDSDNRLMPDSVSRWIRAFARIPDAGLCFAPPEVERAPGFDTPYDPPAPADGKPGCATRGLALATARRYPFLVGGTLLAAWILDEAGGFDESLRSAEDDRLWFRLGLRGTKAVGLVRPIYHRFLEPGSLSRTVAAGVCSDYETGKLLNLADAVRSPAHWIGTGPLMRRLVHRLGTLPWEAHERTAWPAAVASLVRAVEEAGPAATAAGLSTRPLLALLGHRLFGDKPPALSAAGRGPLAASLVTALVRAWETSTPVTARDVRHWLDPETVDFDLYNKRAHVELMIAVRRKLFSTRPLLPPRRLGAFLERTVHLAEGGNHRLVKRYARTWWWTRSTRLTNRLLNPETEG